jgi:hypothetical protein
MRECTFNAGLISDKRSERLQFTTERMFIFAYASDFMMIMKILIYFNINIAEAAAIYCMYSSLREHRLTEPGSKFKYL